MSLASEESQAACPRELDLDLRRRAGVGAGAGAHNGHAAANEVAALLLVANHHALGVCPYGAHPGALLGDPHSIDHACSSPLST